MAAVSIPPPSKTSRENTRYSTRQSVLNKNLLFVKEYIPEVNSVEKKVDKAFTDIQIPEVKIIESKTTTLGNV